MKIKVCVPYYLHYEDLHEGINELVHAREHTFVFTEGKGYAPGPSRNEMVSKSQKKKQTLIDLGGFDYHLFIDSDMPFHLKNILALLARRKDIISGAYIRADTPTHYNAGMWEEDLPGSIKFNFEKTVKGLQKADFLGAGFLLVKTEVFTRIDYPWFHHKIIEKGEVRGEISEDYGFCVAATEAGIERWVDCDTVIEHNVTPPTAPTPQSLPGEFIPGTLAPEMLLINETLGKLSRKYDLCYSEMMKARSAENQAN